MPATLETTFWSDDVVKFSNLCYTLFSKEGESVSVEIDLSASNFEIANKFKQICKVVATEEIKIAECEDKWFQFAVKDKDGTFIPIKWFTLVFDNGVRIDHDIAFDTTLICRNGVSIPLGQFPHWSKQKHFPRHRKTKMRIRALKYVANQFIK